MVNLLLIKFAVIFAVGISVCGGVPPAQISPSVGGIRVEEKDSSIGFPRWLRAAFLALLESAHNDVSEKYDTRHVLKEAQTPDSLNIQAKEEVVPALEDAVSEIQFPPSAGSITDKTNPFFRSKRSTCGIPANLPQLVQDLNSHLSPNQLVGLIPEARVSSPVTGQPTDCPNDATNSWWPRPEINLRSTCPWNITEVDLGENAFPRYINNASCLCIPCVKNLLMRCEDMYQTVSYLYLQSCQDGLAVMKERNVTVNVGCYCATAPLQGAAPRIRSRLTP